MWLEPTVTSNTLEQMNSRMPYYVQTNHNMQLTLIQGCCKLSWIVILFLCGEREKKRKFCDCRSKQLSLFLCWRGLRGRYSKKCSLGPASWKRAENVSLHEIISLCLQDRLSRYKRPCLHFLRCFTWRASLCQTQTTRSRKRGHILTLF